MADEIPALDLTISFANEYGRMSSMRIFGVKLLNEGQVMSINDLYTENTYQFVALGMEPLSSDLLEPGEKEKELNQKHEDEDVEQQEVNRKVGIVTKLRAFIDEFL